MNSKMEIVGQPLNESNNIVLIDERFRLMADHSPVLLWMAREDSLCTYFNATWLNFTGRSLEQEWGVGWCEGLHVEDFQRCTDAYIQAFNRRESFEMIYRLRRYDGEYRWILDRAAPVFDKEKFKGYIGSCIDITEMKQAKEKLEANQAELETTLEELKRSNVDLENFAYLASHDLQAPLRAIASFSGLIAEKIDFSNNPELKEYFDILLQSSREMKGLIEALLNYSRIGRDRDLPSENVDLDALVTETLRVDFVDFTDLEVQFDPLPVVRGKTVLIKRLFVNLLENAYKFRKPGQKSLVKIKLIKEHTQLKIIVEDNGVGIEERYLEKIFGIFTRCHSNAEIKGMGIGLAICKKVIEIHKGKIWVESTPNKGTTFYLTLPHLRVTRSI